MLLTFSSFPPTPLTLKPTQIQPTKRTNNSHRVRNNPPSPLFAGFFNLFLFFGPFTDSMMRSLSPTKVLFVPFLTPASIWPAIKGRLPVKAHSELMLSHVAPSSLPSTR